MGRTALKIFTINHLAQGSLVDLTDHQGGSHPSLLISVMHTKQVDKISKSICLSHINIAIIIALVPYIHACYIFAIIKTGYFKRVKLY